MICNDWKEFFGEFRKILHGGDVNCMNAKAGGVQMVLLPEINTMMDAQRTRRLNISINAPKIDYVKEELIEEFRKMGFNYYRDKLEEFECFQRWYDLAEGNAEDLKELIVRAYDLLGVEVPPIVAEVAFFPRSMARLVW